MRMPTRKLPLLLAGALCVSAALLPRLARAEGAPADTSLTRYLSGLSDSTHAYFKGDSMSFDTTGVDSLARYYQLHPEAAPKQPRDYDPKRGASENAPLVRVTGVEGVVSGARVQLNGIERGPGALSAMVSRAWALHEGRYAVGWTRAASTAAWALSGHVSMYRSTEGLDALEVEPDGDFDAPRTVTRPGSLLFRREGWRLRGLFRTHAAALQLQFRDEQAHALA